MLQSLYMDANLFQPPTEAEWVKAVREAVRDEFRQHACRLSQISDAEVKELTNALGMITDVGQGESRVGMDVIRSNIKWLAMQRERTEQFGRTFFFAVITSVVGGALLAVVLGIKALLETK